MIKSISKTLFIEGMRCLKLLWYRINRPTLAAPLEEKVKYLFQTGHKVEEYAHKLFLGGVLIGNGQRGPFKELLAETEHEIHGSAPFIFEATAANNNMYCRADVLERLNSNRWNLAEIKSCTKLKPEHVYDVAFQCECLRNVDRTVEKAYLLHIDNQYVRQGEIEPSGLMRIEEITSEVMAEIPNIPHRVTAMIKMINKPEPPKVSIGSRCRSPSVCPFAGLCFHDIPESSIFELPYASSRVLASLLKQGISRLVDIPDDFQLSPRQSAQVRSAKTGRPVFMRGEINNFINRIYFPLHYLDTETGSFCIPPWNGASPYRKVVYQFSLHVQEKKNGFLHHYEYLPENTDDPQRRVIEELISHIGDHGSILAWNASFEKSVLQGLADRFPEFADQINSILNRVVDLIVPFRSGAYSDYRFRGSASIKKVLPVLVPVLSYSGMPISAADDSSLAYQKYIEGQMTQEEWTVLRPAMLAYCELDTQAMVRILDVLYNVAEGGQNE
jgi:hypothetical protein